MLYDITELASLESELAQKMKAHFVRFFTKHDYTVATEEVMSFDVADLSDLKGLPYGPGLYVIFTDYQKDSNPCKLELCNLKAIYRGHCYTVKKRLFSHLLNNHYRSMLPANGVRYDVCLKLDGANGININIAPYSSYKWRVVVHKMPRSSKLIREQAELAFDHVFGRPLGSKEVAAKDA